MKTDWLGREQPDEPSRPYGAPPTPPQARRFLLADAGGSSPVAFWIDSPAGCEDRDTCHGTAFHLRATPSGRRFVMRCPKSLSKDEQGRQFVDDQMGAESAKDFIRDARRSKKSRPARERDEHSWNEGR